MPAGAEAHLAQGRCGRLNAASVTGARLRHRPCGRIELHAGDGGDVGGDGRDLLRGQLPLERGHHPLAVRHPLDDLVLRRLRVVEVRPDGAGRARVLERVAARAAGALEDLLALGGQGSSRRPSSAACRRRRLARRGRRSGRRFRLQCQVVARSPVAAAGEAGDRGNVRATSSRPSPVTSRRACRSPFLDAVGADIDGRRGS